MTVHDMVRISENFYVSLGLDPMSEDFWKNSVFEKPNDGREINCHASAWDFYDGKDFRFEINMNIFFYLLFIKTLL